MTKKKGYSNLNRFTEHSHPTREEAGSVKDKNGKELWAGDEGFMEGLAEKQGFEFVDLTEEVE